MARSASVSPAATSTSTCRLLVEAEALGERPHGRAEPLVAEHDRLEVEGEVAERLDRLPVPVERARQHLPRVVEAAFLDRVADRVEHQRDSGERLHRAVVEEEREPPALVLLGRDQLLEQADPLALLAPALPCRRSTSGELLSQ